MKKILNTVNITNELQGASLFFTQRASPPPAMEPEKVTTGNEPKTTENERLEKAAPIPEPQPDREEKVVTKRNTDSSKPEGKTKNHDGMQANMHASNDASMQAFSYESIIEVIRKSVKDIGKDSATYRF